MKGRSGVVAFEVELDGKVIAVFYQNDKMDLPHKDKLSDT